MNQVQNRIEIIKKNGYKLDFKTIFNSILENYKKIAIYAGLMILVSAIVFFLTVFTGLVAFLGVDVVTEMLKPENLNPENFSKEFILIYSACAILFTCLISPFTAGFIKMAYCAERDEEFHLSTFFQYYKFPYLIELFLATFIITLFNTGISKVIENLGFPTIGALTTMIISFFTLLTIPLIIFGKLKAIEAIKNSITIISKQPLIIFNLTAVSLLATALSILAVIAGMTIFFIGIFFTIPFIYSLYYILYKEIIGFEEID